VSDPTPKLFVDISARVDDYWDRGLLGLAVDPGFGQGGHDFVYALYALDAPPGRTAPVWNDACGTPPGPTTDGCVVQGVLSRFPVNADGTAGAEQILLGPAWCQQFPSHSIGALKFGPDGKLYASAGDGASFNYADYGQSGGSLSGTPTPVNPCGDPPGSTGVALTSPTARGGALRSQSPRRPAGEPVLLTGSVLLLDPDTGAGVVGNPRYDSANPSSNASRIVAHGLRNPFRFTFRPTTNELWVGDVGWNTWEEIDRIVTPVSTSLTNFGWPCYEGNGQQAGYAGLNMCTSLYADSANPATPPYYTYSHSATQSASDTCPTSTGSSITGTAFYNGTRYPSQYRGALFFADHSRNCIWVMMPGTNGLPDPANIKDFVTNADNPAPVDLEAEPVSGDIFYVSMENGTIHRISAPDLIPPSAPGTLSGTGGAGTAALQWTAATDNVAVTNYTVYRSTTAGFTPGPTNQIGTTANLTFTDTLPAGGTYYYKVGANDAVGNAGPSSNEIAVVVASPVAGAPTVDVVVAVDGGATAVTAPFSTSTAGELLVAFVGSDGPRSAAQTATVSGAGLTWTLVRRTNTQAGAAEVWQANAPNALTNVTVQSALTNTATPDQSLTVVAFKGASVGASAGAAGATGAPTVGLTTTSGGSLVYAVGNDWDRAQARTLGTGQAMVHQWVNNTTGDTYWVQQLTSPVAASASSVTINDTAPTTDRWNITAVEIKSGDTVAPSAPGTLSASGGAGSAALSWGAATDAVGVTGYTVYRSTVSGFTPGPTNQIGLASGLTFGDSGLAGGTYFYRVTAHDAAGNAGPPSNQASATVTGLPVPVIDTPTAALHWAVGDPINFSGHATDGSGAAIPPANLTWSVLLHHCPSACHTHVVQTMPGASGSFNAPDHDYPSYMELQLTATDAGGRSASTSVRLDPRTVDLTFQTNPIGLQLTVGSSSQATPFTRTVIVGSANSVSAITPQNVGTTTYNFATWSDGLAGTHQIAAPIAAATYTATYTGTGPTLGVDRTVAVDGGATVVTAPFSTSAAGELLVAFVGSDGPRSVAQTATVSGGGLTWTLVRRTNTQAGSAEVWQARAPSALTNVTVQSVLTNSATPDQSLTVVAFKGASGVGTAAGAAGATGAPGVSLTTTSGGSLVFGVGNDWDRAQARTLGTGQAMVHQWVNTATGDTYWVQQLINPIAAGGTSVSINDTAPTADRWNLTAIEIKAA
ncbi:MAG: hypothetical protein JWO88_3575, partial [Frankiales bacterium]|nr:hypothetical protein [Frankiales bacterium]